jgi:hypothetical protein
VWTSRLHLLSLKGLRCSSRSERGPVRFGGHGSKPPPIVATVGGGVLGRSADLQVIARERGLSDGALANDPTLRSLTSWGRLACQIAALADAGQDHDRFVNSRKRRHVAGNVL